jgi:hypothetical protein
VEVSTGSSRRWHPPDASWALIMAAIALGYLLQAIHYARNLLPSGDMVQYLIAGSLAVRGEIGLYEDRLVGNRPPLPFYVLGITQLWGPDLMAARWLNIGWGLATLLITARLAERLGGPRAGILAALFLATQGVVVAYYSAEGYYAFSACCFMVALLALFGGEGAHRRAIGAGLTALLFFVRANLWPAIPFLLAYALYRGSGIGERLKLFAIVAVPALAFFAWDPSHLKLLAYVPVARALVEPLGYRSALALDGRVSLSAAENLWELARLIRRYEFWVLATVLLVAIIGWRRQRGSWPPGAGRGPVAVLSALFAYMLGCQLVMFSWNWKWVGLYFLPFAPLLPVLLGVGFSHLLATARASVPSRALLLLALAGCLALPAYFVRSPLLPVGEARAQEPLARVHDAAGRLKQLVPADAKVFFYGWNVAYYLSGLPKTYLQLVYGDWALPSVDVDEAVLRKSGFVPIRDVVFWISSDADYAVIDPAYIRAHADDFRGAPRLIQELLDRYFVKIATVSDYPAATYEVYRRKTR